MDGWMDELMDDGWMYRWLDVQMHGWNCIDGWMDVWISHLGWTKMDYKTP